jgi:hypothetical protein
MQSRVVGTLSALFLAAGWAAAQPPVSHPTGPPVPSGPPALAASGYPLAPGDGAPADHPFPGPADAPCAADDGAPPHHFEVTKHPGADARFWVSGEWLLWRLDGAVPTEVSTLVNPQDAHRLKGEDYHQGFRTFAGYRFDNGLGVEVGGFYLETRTHSVAGTNTIDAFVNQAAIPNVIAVRLPLDPQGDLDLLDTLTTALRGSITRRLWGLEANARSCRCYFGGLSFDFLAGVRNVNFDEILETSADHTFQEPLADPDEVPGNPENLRQRSIHTFDSVTTRNRFFGPQVGTQAYYCCGPVTLEGWFKLAVGPTYQEVRINGITVIDPAVIEPSPGADTFIRPGGILQGGFYTPGPVNKDRVRVSVIPEFAITLGYNVTPSVRGYVGYNYFYMTQLARPGGASSSLTSGVRSTDLQAYGLSVGMQLRF